MRALCLQSATFGVVCLIAACSTDSSRETEPPPLAETSGLPSVQPPVLDLENRVDRTIEMLDLEDEQRDLAREILLRNLSRLDAARPQRGSGNRPDREDLRRLRSLRQEVDAQIEDELAEILTAEQLDAYRSLREEQRDQMRQRMRRARGRG